MILPLDKRKRKLHLFNLKIKGSEYVDYIEELLKSKLNMGQINLPESEQVVQIIYTLTKIQNKYTSIDYSNAKKLICVSTLTKENLNRLFRDAKIIDYNKNYYSINKNCYLIEFRTIEDACIYLNKSNQYFEFFRYKNFIEIKNFNFHLFVKGSKFNKNIICSDQKLVIGPLFVDEIILRDSLDEFKLNGFRKCNNPDLPFFICEFQFEPIDLIIKILSHITLTYNKTEININPKFLETDFFKNFIEKKIDNQIYLETDLIVQPIYKDVFIIDFNMIKNFENRRLNGPIITSLTPTKIIQILNLLDPEELREKNVNSIKNNILELCLKYGNVKNIIIPNEGCNKFSKPSGSCRIYCECESILDSKSIYENIDGLYINDRLLICSYFPEFNYYLHEFE